MTYGDQTTITSLTENLFDVYQSLSTNLASLGQFSYTFFTLSQTSGSVEDQNKWTEMVLGVSGKQHFFKKLLEIIECVFF
jgi:hypothetical protein